MIKNNKDTKIQTESQRMIESNKPWYKKKNTIIASSSILGAGVLATAIAVPLTLIDNTTDTSTTPIAPSQHVKETITLLNAPENKDARIGLWNSYALELNTPPSAPLTNQIINSPYSDIVYTHEFVNQFINLITDNLYVTEFGTETGAINQAIANSIKTSLVAQKHLFMNNTTTAPGPYVTYTNLFSFDADKIMLNFVDDIDLSKATISIKLYMPKTGLDLIYNDDQTVSIKIMPISTVETNNVRLVIDKFKYPSIDTNKIYYFKPNSTIRLPSTIMSRFENFLGNSINAESTARKALEVKYETFKKSVDVTTTTGLSYWNSYALNYATPNIQFLKEEIAKPITEGSIYTFLKEAILDLSEVDLTEIKTELSKDATNGLSPTPFVQSLSHSNLLFNTKNTDASANNYSLALNFTKFTYDYEIGNFFTGTNIIKISPKLTLSGTFTKTPNGNGNATTTFDIINKTFDFSGLIDVSHVPDTATGGFVGFLNTLIDKPTDPLTTLTNGLIVFNNKNLVDQITAWNSFATSQNARIYAELIKENVLLDFINSYVTSTNKFGHGTFPNIVTDTFKKNFNLKATSLSPNGGNLSFADPTSNSLPAITLSEVVWGPNGSNDKFTSIKIYFGYETDSINNINVNSTLAGANMSLSQTISEPNTTYGSVAEVHAAAKKRLSIVFETTNSTHVVYFGQQLVGSQQVASPITIPNTILTSFSKFIEFIQGQK